MSVTAAEVLIDTLHDWGVDRIFGMPGDGINGIMEALRFRQDRIQFIQVRHEEAAAFMACAHAKYTGQLGVCLATSGPGGLHLLNGLYDAKLDGQPVLAITGMPFHDLIGTKTQQDVELDKVFMDVAVYNERVMGAAHIENIAHLACRTALSYRGVAHITFPVDLQDSEVSKPTTKRNVPNHTSDVFAIEAGFPSNRDLDLAAAVLNGGEKVVILAGRGALGASEELELLAERLGAPIVKALLGKGSVPDDSPYTTGTIGLLGTKPSQEVLEECDTLLIAGSSFPYIEFLPKPGQARGVQIDMDPMRIGLRYPIEVGLVGQCRKTLNALLPMVQQKEDRSFLEKTQKGMKVWWALMEARGTNQSTPMKPQVVAWELGKQLRNSAIVSSDSGTIATWWARQVPAKADQLHSVSGNLASMANGLPYAMAAQLAYPDRQCVAFVGDGGFSMLMAELATCVKYQLPVKVIIIKNNTLGMIKWEQMVFLGNPEYGCELHPINFALFAEACGAKGLTIDDPQHCAATLQEAFETPGPVIIEALVDPFEPPMPPKVTLDQAAKFAHSLAKGEPNRDKIALTVLSDKVRELI
ncbi:thiamine pyrophosphate-dependent enzyme [Candidatus Nitronereus thalassa]|uniref:Thiamine pyrophosphate-binding protein n=1 Tax=Candidatus Nitronereus thalassa TaxID=3020898 RepID=A0ABU3KB85_9BACT|nr:thiamine pyrophosphate-dependent enzyme [Candidatus Nitronereus thalassa]MDT7043754.1 thiamine pyrophosphate-binding protein [Candidatus Nitronereus thalassa]